MNKRQKIVQAQFLNDEEEVIRRLKSIYGESLKEIEKKAQAMQEEINRLGTMAKLSTDADEKARLLSMQQSKIYQKQYQDAMKKQIGSVLDNMQVEEFKTVSEYLQKCYEDGFIGTMFDLHGQGIPLCFPLDQEAMVTAVQLDSKISKGLYASIGENVAELKKHITAEVSRGIAQGSDFHQIARQLRGHMMGNYTQKTGGALYRSELIARTEGHRIQVQSAIDACYKAKDKGADVVKQWDSTLDGRTRESHQAVDGEIRELDKKFSNGFMFPGDPSGGAAEVCNCRCALLQRARWALDEDELQTLKDRAAFYGLDKSDTFADFKEKYIKAADELQHLPKTINQDRIRQRKEAWKQRQAAKKEVQNKPDFDSMDRKQLVSWASENLKTKFEDVTGANTDYLREAVKVINDLEERLGGKTIGGLSVKFGGTPSGVHAKYDDATRTVLLKKSGSLKAFTESNQKTNERALRKLGKNYYATETFSGTIWHELGHAVDMDTGQALSAALSSKDLDVKSVKISVYAGSTQGVRVTRRSEAWAENFSAYMDNGANAKDVPAEIIQMIEEYFNKKRAD